MNVCTYASVYVCSCIGFYINPSLLSYMYIDDDDDDDDDNTGLDINLKIIYFSQLYS